MAGLKLELDQRLQDLVEGATIAVFDFDGVIADTEPLHAASYGQLLAPWGISFAVDEFEEYVGKPDVEIYCALGQRFGIDINPEEAGERRRAIFLESVRRSGLRPYSYVQPLLHVLKRSQTPALIVSAQMPTVVEELLVYWALRPSFQSILTIHDQAEGTLSKLDLIAALPRGLGTPAQEILLFEDSPTMLSKAKIAGMLTVAIVHSLSRRVQSHADFVLNYT